MAKILYTSYFAKADLSNPLAYAITVKVPDWAGKNEGRRLNHCPDLAPTFRMLRLYKNNYITEAQYKDMYLHELNSRGKTPQQVADALPDGAILLCYERRGQFCHRHIAAEWLREGGIEVKEL